jgi:hypothetical protein
VKGWESKEVMLPILGKNKTILIASSIELSQEVQSAK